MASTTHPAERQNARVRPLLLAQQVLRPIRSLLHRYRALHRRAETWRSLSGEGGGRAAAWLRLVRIRLRPERTVLFYPDLPRSYAVAYRLGVVSGFRMVNRPNVPHQSAIRWLDQEKVDPSTLLPLRMVNAACNDITKTHVSEVFARVFGYDLLVDPTAYHGSVVKKSDLNATHDGEVIQCPIPAEAVVLGYVYQKEIATLDAEGRFFSEYRVPIHGDTIPLVYVKYRPKGGRFKEFSHAELAEPEAVLSADERRDVLAFCRALGMDYGELDVLRDTADGKIYIVDANNTPSGPSRGFRHEQRVEALRRLQPSFHALLDRFSSASPSEAGLGSGIIPPDQPL